ncbi:MAG: carotenoid oxygenase family protein [Microthrixaceae bacterium]|nr:carotenoid oxygenase family protein [Microthrixaceae bacterium]
MTATTAPSQTALPLGDAALAAWTRCENPHLIGQYRPVHDEIDVDHLEVQGELPAGLVGSYVRNGPNPFFAPTGAYHLFDGDAMLHGVTLDGSGAAYRNRWIRSAGLLAEVEAGHPLFGGLAEYKLPPDDVIAKVGVLKNTANTNIVAHGGRMLALMEAAPPTEVDPATLATVGEFSFGGALAGPMTAHPKVDPDTGNLHFFGYSPLPPFLRYHVASPDGVLLNSTEIEIPQPVMMHDFVITDRHAVFFDLPAVFDIAAMMEGRPFTRWEPDLGARIGTIALDGTGDVTWHEIDPCYVFHFLNASETVDGVIEVIGCRAETLPVSFGDQPPADVSPTLHRWTIDTAGSPAAPSVTTTRLDDRPGDFPRIDDRLTGRPNRFGYVGCLRDVVEGDATFGGVTAWDFQRNESTTWECAATEAVGEPAFAPDPAGTAENDGWLTTITTDLARDRSYLDVLDARDVAAGPVARVKLPRRVPFGFHGNWFPAG